MAKLSEQMVRVVEDIHRHLDAQKTFEQLPGNVRRICKNLRWQDDSHSVVELLSTWHQEIIVLHQSKIDSLKSELTSMLAESLELRRQLRDKGLLMKGEGIGEN